MYYEDLVKMLSLLFWGVVVHLVLLAAVFDIHFRSPVVQNVSPTRNELSPLADRLVLFVGDGIRADSFFRMDRGKSNAPFLRSIIDTSKVWGISHAHVPTESRPGHVAIIAGMYEDPSAIFKGWQNYLVDFDSVLNCSEASFSFGSPDILNIFSRGSKKQNMFNFMYSEHEQEFSGKSGSAEKLSYWVADRFDAFLKNLKFDSDTKEIISRKKIVFFFHFLGTDIAGHTSKPYSDDYVRNIMVVDKCVKRITNSINAYFNDNKTAFIFTSDHGMTDWGSHGDGTDDETLTPFVAWGAGLKSPTMKYKLTDSEQVMHIPDNWQLSNYYKFDIEQADIAPLMSVLIGIPIPVNSVGILPVGFFDADIKWILEAVKLNAKQLKAQFIARRTLITNKVLNIFYYPFDESKLELNSYKTAKSTSPIDVSNALDVCDTLINGIKYYKDYFSNFLLKLLSLLYIGWILHLIIEVVKRSKLGSIVFSYNFHYLNRIDTWESKISTIAKALYLTALFLLLSQNLQINFYIYVFLTIWIWQNIVPCLKQMYSAFPLVNIQRCRVFLLSLFFLVGLELLVYSFKKRSIVFYSVNCLNIFWMFETHDNIPFYRGLFLWFLSTIVVSIFPLLPTIGSYYSIGCVLAASGLWLISQSAVIYLIEDVERKQQFIHLGLILLAGLNSLVVDVTFYIKQGLSSMSQIISWSVLCLTLITLTLGPKLLHNKFLFVCHGLSAPFILLSSAHEGIFLFFLYGHLFIWISLEHFRSCIHNKESSDYVLMGSKVLKYSDFRVTYFFLNYILLAFFGIGNIASLNSFDPSWVRTFLTTFSPFTMMTLIIFKTLIPIFMVVCSLRVIIAVCEFSLEIIFCIILLFCDVIGLHLFLSVTNEGSWLEIGTSLSHFILIEVLTLFLLLLYGLSLIILPNTAKTKFGLYLSELEKDKINISVNIF